MQRSQQLVRQFHALFGLAINDKPVVPSEEILRLRCKLLLEEVLEFCTAAGFVVDCTNDSLAGGIEIELEKDQKLNPNLIEMADALTDIQYVNDGAAISLGLDLELLTEEVHRSNMSKLWNSEEVAELSNGVLENWPHGNKFVRERFGEGKWIIRVDNKVIKSPGYSKADIKQVLINQGAENL